MTPIRTDSGYAYPGAVDGSAGNREVNGILLLDKPQGITSHDAVARVRRALGTRKVGHAGTLDPKATGLLVVGVGASTRLLTHLVGLDKEYVATIRLGQATTTDDAEGEILATRPTDGVADSDIVAGVAALTGELLQRPSAVSAIKVGGVRAYERVRAGEDVELAPRRVTIRAFEILNMRRGECIDLDVRVECSSGTYIRALARDLGQSLGVGGHLTALRRTRVGPFSIDEAVPVPEWRGAASEAEGRSEAPPRLLDPAEVAERLFPVLRLDAQQAADLANGKRIAVAAAAVPAAAALAPSGRLIGLVAVTGGTAKVIVNFPTDPSTGSGGDA